MTRTRLVNFYEDGWDLAILSRIYSKIEAYLERKGSVLLRVEEITDNSRVDEDNERFDVAIIYRDPIYGTKRARLYYLKGEIYDEMQFNKKYTKFYGGLEDMQVV